MSSKNNARPSEQRWVDPTLADYEKALEALSGGKLPTAHKLFQSVAESAEQTDLAARARGFAELCARRLEEATAPEDPYLEAVFAKNQGRLEDARDLCARGGRKGKDDRFAYLAASVEALDGNDEEAVRQLQQAIELNPKNRVHAFHDSDFQSLRGLEEFDALYAD